MGENVLKDLETFDEFPDKILVVNNNSDYYYITKEEKNFVTERNIDSISNIDVDGEEKVLVKSSYYDVINGSLICKTEFISDINKKNKKFTKCDENIKIISLNDVLNINGIQESYLTKEEIETLINYKEENAKTYGMTPRENYF